MRRHEEEEDNKERWLVSYADFITLLFAFFVVMYSISSVNEGKYKVLSQSLEGVFNTKEKTIEPIQVGDYQPLSENQQSGRKLIKPVLDKPEPIAKEVPKEVDEDLQLEEIAGEFIKSFEDLIFEEHLTIEQKEDWIEISLNESIVFDSGGVEPFDEALVVLEKIADILKDRQNVVLVEGHTDNLPIRGTVFPSNWELSAARAAVVVRFLALEGIEPERMAAIGFGEFNPIPRNDTSLGRKRNRRVVLLISKKNDVHETFLN